MALISLSVTAAANCLFDFSLTAVGFYSWPGRGDGGLRGVSGGNSDPIGVGEGKGNSISIGGGGNGAISRCRFETKNVGRLKISSSKGKERERVVLRKE